ncbi:histidine kinase [Nonomuraea sp. NPDC049725]|uniref:sensor histidine kinase n=1 Tax=Nonomuraea sp. NPDC049725 TaxID=3154508 RepID=UPI00343A14D8
MNGRDRRDERTRATAEAGLAAVFAVLLAFWARQVATSWGPGYWAFGCVAGAIVCGLALARRRARRLTAFAGFAVAVAAALTSRSAGLPAEPGPAMALGLSVLVGSAVRVLPVRQAAAVAGGGLAVAACTLLTARPSAALPPVLALNLGAWLAGAATGLAVRLLHARRHARAEDVRRHERLRLARELHDVVAHHVTGIVLQAQAAQVLARKQPDRVSGSLTGIESAGSDALAATRRLVGLLREPTPPPRESLTDLVGRYDAPPAPARRPRRGGYGLLGMRERLDALGGTLDAGPRPEPGGWSVRATLPLPGERP